MENPIKMGMIWGKTHYFWKHPYRELEDQGIYYTNVPWILWAMVQVAKTPGP